MLAAAILFVHVGGISSIISLPCLSLRFWIIGASDRQSLTALCAILRIDGDSKLYLWYFFSSLYFVTGEICCLLLVSCSAVSASTPLSIMVSCAIVFCWHVARSI